MREMLVLGRLGTLLRREGTEPGVLAIFSREAVLVILLYGLEMWVIVATFAKRVGGTDTEFLCQIMGKRVRRLRYRK